MNYNTFWCSDYSINLNSKVMFKIILTLIPSQNNINATKTLVLPCQLTFHFLLLFSFTFTFCNVIHPKSIGMKILQLNYSNISMFHLLTNSRYWFLKKWFYYLFQSTNLYIKKINNKLIFFSNFTFCASKFANPYQQLKTSLTKWLSFVKGNALGKRCS